MAKRKVSFLITAKNKGFIKALDQSGRRLRRFGYKMERMGRTLTQNITMPVAAAGGAAVKMASDFESSLAQAQAQADLTAEQVSFIGDSAKETAKRTGESTDDIIEAYKFTISAGKNLAESQEIVEAAAEAAAAGFGTQRDLVRTATTALEAYSDRIDSGREFMDLLVGSAQKMELEVDKLSGAMQRNVGVANELGIGLDELLAGIGSVSEIMGDAQRGGRLFQTMITNLLSPTGKAKEAIEGVFGSLQGLHRSIREDGLLKTMVRLRKELEANSQEGLGLVFSQRSLEAALNFTNNEGQRTNQILSNMGDTAGSTKSAFDDVSDTTERRFKRALQNLKVAAIELGQTLLPIVNDIIDVVSEWVTWFSELDKSTQQNIIQTAAFAAALGPMLTVGGKAVKMLGSMQKTVASLATAFKTGSLAIWGWIGAVAALGVANFKANQRDQDRIDAISEEVKQIETLEGATNRIVEIEEKRARLQRQMAKGARGLGKELEDLNQELEETIAWRDHLASQELQAMGSGGGDTTGGNIGGGSTATPALSGINIEAARAGMESLGNTLDKVSVGALRRASSQFDTIKEAMQGTTEQAEVMGQALQSTVTGAVSSFAETLGNAFTGDAGARGFFNNLILIVVDFANKFGKMLVAAGVAAQAFQSLLTNPIGAIIAGGALIALTTAIRNLLTEGPSQSVGDALIRSDGSIVRLHPNDDVLAMQDFGNLQPAMAGSQVIKNELFLDGNTVWNNQRRVNTNKRR